MIAHVRFSFATAIILLLAACASPQMNYHTLVPAAAPTHATPPAPFLIAVLPVGVPPQIDLPQLVVRQGEGGVGVLDNERWLSALSDEVRTALAAGLVAQLNTQDISGLPRPADNPVIRVLVQIRRLDAWPGQHVQLEADWSLSQPGAERSARLVCASRFTENAPGGIPQLVAAEQRVFAHLATQISTHARQWYANPNASCTG